MFFWGNFYYFLSFRAIVSDLAKSIKQEQKNDMAKIHFFEKFVFLQTIFHILCKKISNYKFKEKKYENTTHEMALHARSCSRYDILRC